MPIKNQESNYYLSEDGMLVFTEKYHLERGYCCGLGCKHCPYQHINVIKQVINPINKNLKQEEKNG